MNVDQLLNTDFGVYEKLAQEKIATAQEMYQRGFDMALETANEMDAMFKQAAEEAEAAEKEEEAKKKEEESKSEEEKTASISMEKTASDLAAFIEKGYTDGLMKIAQERYGDQLVYLMPMIEEKVAMAGAEAALEKFANIRQAGGKVVAGARSIADDVTHHAKATYSGAKSGGSEIKKGVSNTWNQLKAGVTGKDAKGKALTGTQRAANLGRAAAKGGAAAGVAGAGAAGGYALGNRNK